MQRKLTLSSNFCMRAKNIRLLHVHDCVFCHIISSVTPIFYHFPLFLFKFKSIPQFVIIPDSVRFSYFSFKNNFHFSICQNIKPEALQHFHQRLSLPPMIHFPQQFAKNSHNEIRYDYSMASYLGFRQLFFSNKGIHAAALSFHLFHYLLVSYSNVYRSYDHGSILRSRLCQPG